MVVLRRKTLFQKRKKWYTGNMKKYLPLFIILGIAIVLGVIFVVVSQGKNTNGNDNTNTAALNPNVNSSGTFAANTESSNTNGVDNATHSLTTNTVNTSTGSASNDAQLAKLAASPTATVETDFGTFTIKFYSADAPALTKNFLVLAKKGYYDNLTFHRIVPGFVIQGGDPNGDGTGGQSSTGTGLADEPGALQLHHLRGAVAWAKSSAPNSIGSQFYVALDELEQLDGSYSVFGQVISGMDIVDKIAAVPTDSNDKPTTPVHIKSVTITD